MVEEGLEESIVSSGKEDNHVQISKEEQIGYHKGSINTLVGERNELLKMISITEQLINAHASELSKLGVKIKNPKTEQK